MILVLLKANRRSHSSFIFFISLLLDLYSPSMLLDPISSTLYFHMLNFNFPIRYFASSAGAVEYTDYISAEG